MWGFFTFRLIIKYSLTKQLRYSQGLLLLCYFVAQIMIFNVNTHKVLPNDKYIQYYLRQSGVLFIFTNIYQYGQSSGRVMLSFKEQLEECYQIELDG